jgi:DNA-binding CsgD family transcriptional regulator
VDGAVDTGAPLERESEISAIESALHGGATAGHLIVVEGPSGIGKSRLLDEALCRARADGRTVLTARGGELEQKYPFGLAIRLIEAHWRAERDRSRAGGPGGYAALARPLFDPADPPTIATGPEEFGLVHGLYWCVADIHARQPVTIIVDDCHWADDASLRFLNYLTRRLDDLPVVVIIAVRTGDPGARDDLIDRLVRAPGTVRLRPRELSLDATRNYLQTTMTSDTGEDQVRTIWAATKGNPLLLRTVADALNEGASLQLAAYDIATAVTRRLTRLGTASARLARACAVLGDDLPIQAGIALAGLDDGAAAHQLAEARILHSPKETRFEHPLVRSAVYADIDVSERRDLHIGAARALYRDDADPSVVAGHLSEGALPDERWVLEALLAGSHAASRRGAPELAVHYLRRAVNLTAEPRDEARVLLQLGLSEAAAGGATSISRFERASAILNEPRDKAAALRALGETLYRKGRHEPAIEAFRRGAALLEDTQPELAQMLRAELECAAVFVRGYRVEDLEPSVRGVADRPPMALGDRVALAVTSMCSALSGDDAALAARLAMLALSDGTLLRTETSDGLAVKLAIFALIFSDNAAAAVREATRLRDDAVSRCSPVAIAEASMVCALARLAQGRINEAMNDAQTALDAVHGRDWRTAGPVPRAVLIACRLERDELEAAAAALPYAEAERTDHPGVDAWQPWVRGRVRLAQGDPGGALADLLLCGRLASQAGIRNPGMLAWRLDAGIAAHVSGDSGRAAELLVEERRRAALVGLPGVAARIDAVQASLAGNLDQLEGAVTQLRRSDDQLALAKALTALGSMKRRTGQRVACRPILREALDLAHRVGAVAAEHRARDELLASGAKPRRAVLHGTGSLTPSERRIATLAATGDGNDAIAERLYLTRSTVAWHLSRVYKKLDISSRDALAERLARDD